MSNNDFREVDDDGKEVVTGDVVETDTSDVESKDNTNEENKGDKEDGYENLCFICHRTESQAGPMINIGSGVHICNECMQRTFDSMNNFNNTTENTGGAFDFSKMPNIGMINLADFGMPNSQKIKKKKPKTKTKAEGEENKEGEDEGPVIDIKNILPPHEIKARLDEYVVGQEYAKKVMSVAVYNHYKRVAKDQDDDIEIEKSNMLMIGPTGSGKTYLVKTLARLLDVPLAITDATSLTEAGYIGDDIESVVSKLLSAADNDVEKAECGIIFIDEIDKLAKKKNANQRDVSGESVQQGMLKLLEGAEVEVPVGASSKNAMVPMTTIDTKNILFICGGAFPDLDKIVAERLNKSSAMGFTGELRDKYDKDKDILMKTTTEDLKTFGMIPEFLGRLPILFATQALDEDMLVRILKEPKNAILKQYQKLLALDEVDLRFTDGALRAIAKKAMDRDLGARALRAIIEEFMLDIMYEIPKDDNIGAVEITEEYISGNGGPSITMRGSVAIEDKSK